MIKAADGTTLATFYYENRQSVSLDDVAPTMRQAIVAIEDSRFYEHHGVDPKGILRALLTDTSSGAAVQGASTITQQYVRQALVETNAQDNNTAAAAAATSKNLTRKLTEARYALALEQKLSKDQILEDYLNTVYFGDGAYGISAAAQHYFGETADQLTLAQSALLAGVINNPSTFDPTVNPKNALARRNIVLDRMLVNYPDTYTAAQIEAAKAAPLGLNIRPRPERLRDVVRAVLLRLRRARHPQRLRVRCDRHRPREPAASRRPRRDDDAATRRPKGRAVRRRHGRSRESGPQRRPWPRRSTWSIRRPARSKPWPSTGRTAPDSARPR